MTDDRYSDVQFARRVAWWLTLLPFARFWWTQAPSGVERGWLLVVVTTVVVVAARWTRWTAVATAAGYLVLRFLAGAEFVGHVYPLTVLAGLAWGIVSGGLDPPRWRRHLPDRRGLVPAAVPLALGGLLLLVDPLQLYQVRRLLWVFVVLAAPPVLAHLAPGPATLAANRLLQRASEPATAAIAPFAARTGRWWVRVCSWGHDVARRWWGGQLPAGEPAGDAPLAPRSERAGVRDRLRCYRIPLVAYLSTLVVVTASKVISPALPPRPDRGWFDPESMRYYLTSPDLVTTWVRWDSHHYLDIARNGYGYEPGLYVHPDGTQEPAGWMPGYSLVIRYVTMPFRWLLGERTFEDVEGPEQFAVLITIASGLAVALLFWRWLAQMGVDGRPRTIALLGLLWFPYNFVLYGAAYSDPLFLALVLWAFVLWNDDRPLVAGLVGAFAVVVRINGLALIAALAVLAVTIGARRRRRGHVAAPLLAAGGLVAFVAWCGVRYGEPLLYWNAHKAIFGSIEFTRADQLFKVDFFPSIGRRWNEQTVPMINLLVEAALTVFCVVSLPAVVRRFGAAYAALVAVQAGIIWFGSFDFIGAGRYLIIAFPVVALWGEWMGSGGAARRRGSAVWLSTGAVGVLYLTYAFCHTIDLGW